MTYLSPESALSRLKHEAICFIVLQDGRKAEAIWSAPNKGFYYHDGDEARFIDHGDIYEWWPASVKL